MIKRNSKKKKKGFTLIELVIVLAVMAIIALIAIPNFSAIRDNSKNKADKESCEVIKRTVLMLVSDESIKVKEETTIDVSFNNGDIVLSNKNKLDQTEIKVLKEALNDVKKPQGKVPNETSTDNEKWTYKDEKATQFEINIKLSGDVTVIPKGDSKTN